MKICVVGLGYVGLPLVIEFAKIFPTIGFDINEKRIEELKKGNDWNGETAKAELDNPNLMYTYDPKKITESDFIIVTIPTPIDENFKPDLSFLKKALGA